MGKLNWRSKADIDMEQANIIKQNEIESLKQYLNDTDFYVIRQLDTGKPIPKDVGDKRIGIRQRLNELGL